LQPLRRRSPEPGANPEHAGRRLDGCELTGVGRTVRHPGYPGLARTVARTFHVWTIGCQMNLADSESLARQLLAAGYRETPDMDRADIAILNTCVLPQASEDKGYSKLHELPRWETADPTDALTRCTGR